MEEHQTLAIPPGVVPSESKEDLYRKLCYEEDEENTSILKQVIAIICIDAVNIPLMVVMG